MKHPESPDIDDRGAERLVEQLLEGATALGVTMTREQGNVLVTYLERLIAKNREINLTRITEPEEAVRLHLLDSIAAMPELGACPPGEMLDLGSGGGLPGIPLAVVSGRKTLLLDSVGKKARAVQEIVDALGLGSLVATDAGRAEERPRAELGHYAAVVARAVAPLPSLVELASPLLKQGGRLIALKARPSDDEFASGLRAAKIAGMEYKASRQFVLPGGEEQRMIVVYEKSGKSQVALPRRAGLAQHNPLA